MSRRTILILILSIITNIFACESLMTDFDKANPPIIMETDTAPPDSSVNDSDLNDSGVNDSGVNDSGLNDSGMNLMMYTTGHPAHLSNISIIMP